MSNSWVRAGYGESFYCKIHSLCLIKIQLYYLSSTHVLCRREREQRRIRDEKSDAHAANRGQVTYLAFTEVEYDKKVTKAAGAITSNGGMPCDYQVRSSLCPRPRPSSLSLAVKESGVSTWQEAEWVPE